MKLDWDAPYGEVHGLPGARYEQNGMLFNAHGDPAVILPDDPPEHDANDDGSEVKPAEVQDSPSGDDPMTMPFKHLKALVESYGGTCKSRADAIAFLKGKS